MKISILAFILLFAYQISGQNLEIPYFEEDPIEFYESDDSDLIYDAHASIDIFLEKSETPHEDFQKLNEAQQKLFLFYLSDFDDKKKHTALIEGDFFQYKERILTIAKQFETNPEFIYCLERKFNSIEKQKAGEKTRRVFCHINFFDKRFSLAPLASFIRENFHEVFTPPKGQIYEFNYTGEINYFKRYHYLGDTYFKMHVKNGIPTTLEMSDSLKILRERVIYDENKKRIVIQKFYPSGQIFEYKNDTLTEQFSEAGVKIYSSWSKQLSPEFWLREKTCWDETGKEIYKDGNGIIKIFELEKGKRKIYKEEPDYQSSFFFRFQDLIGFSEPERLILDETLKDFILKKEIKNYGEINPCFSELLPSLKGKVDSINLEKLKPIFELYCSIYEESEFVKITRPYVVKPVYKDSFKVWIENQFHNSFSDKEAEKIFDIFRNSYEGPKGTIGFWGETILDFHSLKEILEKERLIEVMPFFMENTRHFYKDFAHNDTMFFDDVIKLKQINFKLQSENSECNEAKKIVAEAVLKMPKEDPTRIEKLRNQYERNRIHYQNSTVNELKIDYGSVWENRISFYQEWMNFFKYYPNSKFSLKNVNVYKKETPPLLAAFKTALGEVNFQKLKTYEENRKKELKSIRNFYIGFEWYEKNRPEVVENRRLLNYLLIH